MRRALRRFYVVTVLVLAVAGLVTLALLQPVLGTRTDFSVYNTRWNGASALAVAIHGTGSFVPTLDVDVEDGEMTLVQKSFADFDVPPRGTSLVLLGPAVPPTPEEAAWLRGFVRGGGRLLLADDFGAGNAFLEALGSASRFSGLPMMDLAFARHPAFAVAASFEPHPVTAGAREAVLDRPTALRESPDAAVLARTGASAWLDRDGDALPDPREPRGPFAWLAVERVGEGEVLILSDPSLLINGMAAAGDNARLRDGVVAWLTQDGRRVLVDESHHDYADPLKLLGTTLRRLPAPARLGLALAASALFLVLALVPQGRALLRRPAWTRRALERLLPPPPPPPARDLVAKVLERHPDWDENALRRILAAGDKP